MSEWWARFYYYLAQLLTLLISSGISWLLFRESDSQIQFQVVGVFLAVGTLILFLNEVYVKKSTKSCMKLMLRSFIVQFLTLFCFGFMWIPFVKSEESQ